MKLIHLSDLHLGKRLHEFSLYEDQAFILQQLVELIRGEQPDAVLIAGDIYDKSIPSEEAVSLFDAFLRQLAAMQLTVCVISGNHDSAERLAFGASLMAGSGVHLATAYAGKPQEVVLQDEYGPVHIFLLPFVKPALVRHALEQLGEAEAAAQITSYQAALEAAVARLPLAEGERNVLVAHQFVTGATTCDSETANVGGVENVGAEIFSPFDYVALGHIHGPQQVGSERLRYCGTPLKYSFSECQQQKSVTVVELGAPGELRLRLLPLVPLRELHSLRGSYEELMRRDNYQQYPKDSDGSLRDLFHITLTDEEDVPDVLQRLRSVYKNLLQLEYDNQRTRGGGEIVAAEDYEQLQPLELLQRFYEQQNEQEPGAEQLAYLEELLEQQGGAR